MQVPVALFRLSRGFWLTLSFTALPGPAAGQGLTVTGRVFARAAFERTDVNVGGTPETSERLQLAVPSARISLDAAVLPWLALDVEMDVADRPLLRDAFLLARSERLRARGGQFKMPVSSITMESPWTLPIARRGILQDLLHDHMRVLGRRPGFQASVRRAVGDLNPELVVAAFQGGWLAGTAQSADFRLLETGVDAQNLIGRFRVTPRRHDFAVFAQRLSTNDFRNERRHFWAAGADARIGHDFSGHGLRVWIEGMAGRTTYVGADAGGSFVPEDGTYLAARTVAAWRRGGMSKGEGYLEPFVFFGLLDPDTDRAGDVIWEGFAGLNAGFWRQARVTLQLEMAKGQRNLPEDLFLGGRNLADHKAALLQIGASF